MSTQTPTWIRHNKISADLDKLQEREIVRTWQAQGDMPGTRWHLEGFGFSTRSMTTAEVEFFILGASEAWNAAQIMSGQGSPGFAR
jgi:hypothetical protein